MYEPAFLQSSIKLRDDCLAPGAVTWGTCTDNGNFQYDSSNTYSVPSPAVKGSNVQLHLEGTFTDIANLKGLKVYVTIGGIPLYINDFPRAKDYQPGDQYVDNITWLIPSFAPSGDYVAQIQLHDAANTIYGCVSANFCFP